MASQSNLSGSFGFSIRRRDTGTGDSTSSIILSPVVDPVVVSPVNLTHDISDTEI